MTHPVQAPPKAAPLANVIAAGLWNWQAGDGWCRVAAAGAVTAEVVHPPDAFLCRLDPPGGEAIVQLSVGRVRSTLCDPLFSPAEDLGLRFAGRGLRLAWDQRRGRYRVRCRGDLTVWVRRDVYRRSRGIKWYRALDRGRFDRPPAGWCSWYIYYKDVDERRVLRNARWLARNLAPFGLTVVQVDDGWQGSGTGHGGDRDWFVTCTEKFPGGMKRLAGRLRAAGLTPGIWLIPFTQSNTDLFRRQPQMFVRDERGRSVNELDEPLPHEYIPPEERRFKWSGRYLLDPTHPQAREYLETLLHTICDEWGYDYVKIDAQGYMVGNYATARRHLAKPAMEPDEVYREGLAAVRRAMGPKRFCLNCTGGWDSAGLCDGIRTGGDVRADVTGIEAALDCTMRWLFLNGIAWWTDPDVLCVRPPLTLAQARTWATLLGITGQVLMAGDDMPRLDERRVELLRRVLPAAPVRPMELYPLPRRPAVFDLKVHKPSVGEWDVAAVFNWSRSWTAGGRLSAEMLGIPAWPKGFVFFDVWRRKVLAAGASSIRLRLPPMSCRVVSIRRRLDRPQLVGTSRHLTQGVDDLQAVRWSGRSATLSGRCRVVAADPYRIWFTVPPGWRVLGEVEGVRAGVGTVVLRSTCGGTRPWKVCFSRGR